MKIAFVGKGGSGKTTLLSLFTEHVSSKNIPIYVIDADINQHLHRTLGISDDRARTLPGFGQHTDEIKKYLRGTNTRYTPDEMIKTTPPGNGSVIIDGKLEQDPYLEKFFIQKNNFFYGKVGDIDESDIGHACYHSKTGALELLLNHIKDDSRSIIAVDMTAGADAFASGLFAQFDLIIIVIEPTLKSIDVYTQYKMHTENFTTELYCIGNKIESPEDWEFITTHIPPSDIHGYIGYSPAIKKQEQTITPPTHSISPENDLVFEKLSVKIMRVEKNWKAYLQRIYYFHRINATNWGNTKKQKNLAEQIDPYFQY